MAAYVRTIAGKRGRNVQLAEQAVLQSRAFTEEEALKATPPLIDLVATEPRRSAEEARRPHRHALRRHARRRCARRRRTVVPIEMTLRQRILSAIAHPNIAYILLSLGTLGLTIELWSPGAVLPGVVGGLSLLLAFFALQVLPINYAGLLLMLFGLLLLALEDEGDELRPADGRRPRQPDLRIADADRFAGARAAVEPRPRRVGRARLHGDRGLSRAARAGVAAAPRR